MHFVPVFLHWPMIRQVATLPHHIDETGQTRVLLITSRRTGRWVIPKGNRMPGLSLQNAAAREAYEEAGVSGTSSTKSLGKYRYIKHRRDGSTRSVIVKVFALSVETQLEKWPEKSQRDTRWFSLEDAAAAVDEPGLKKIITAFVA